MSNEIMYFTLADEVEIDFANRQRNHIIDSK